MGNSAVSGKDFNGKYPNLTFVVVKRTADEKVLGGNFCRIEKFHKLLKAATLSERKVGEPFLFYQFVTVPDDASVTKARGCFHANKLVEGETKSLAELPQWDNCDHYSCKFSCKMVEIDQRYVRMICDKKNLQGCLLTFPESVRFFDDLNKVEPYILRLALEYDPKALTKMEKFTAEDCYESVRHNPIAVKFIDLNRVVYDPASQGGDTAKALLLENLITFAIDQSYRQGKSDQKYYPGGIQSPSVGFGDFPRRYRYDL